MANVRLFGTRFGLRSYSNKIIRHFCPPACRTLHLRNTPIVRFPLNLLEERFICIDTPIYTNEIRTSTGERQRSRDNFVLNTKHINYIDAH